MKRLGAGLGSLLISFAFNSVFAQSTLLNNAVCSIPTTVESEGKLKFTEVTIIVQDATYCSREEHGECQVTGEVSLVEKLNKEKLQSVEGEIVSRTTEGDYGFAINIKPTGSLEASLQDRSLGNTLIAYGYRVAGPHLEYRVELTQIKEVKPGVFLFHIYRTNHKSGKRSLLRAINCYDNTAGQVWKKASYL